MAGATEWSGEQGAKWAAAIDPMDRQVAPATQHAMAALAARPGERIIDLGCGGGATSLEIAEAVGAQGAVFGVDISPDLVEIARSRGAQIDHLTFEVADAATHPFQEQGWDAVFSRFGCMFFDEPAEALANLRAGVKADGRAVLTVWAEPKHNPWAMIPARAAAQVLGPAEKVPPGAPGPFGWATPDIFMPILQDAGWRDIAFEEHEIECPIGPEASTDPVASAIDHAARIGPMARRLEEAPEAIHQIRPILADALAPMVRDGAVYLPGRIRVISATA
ncbi:MAG: methyltransferase domain-containing protein [Pseudomonadota bacterium]